METKVLFGMLFAVALVLFVSTAYAFPFGILEDKGSTGNNLVADEELVPHYIPGTMTTSGTAIVNADPDRVEIQIGIEIQDEHADDAEQEAARIMEAVRNKMKDTGLSYEIETGSYNIYPRYNYDYYDLLHDDTRIIGYTITHIISVKSNDTSNVGKLIDAAASVGSNKIYGIYFSLSDEKKEEIGNLALAKAAKNAKSKADTITSALGLSVKRITKITESLYNPYPIYYGYKTMETASVSSDYQTQVEPSDVSVSATVSMEFEFE